MAAMAADPLYLLIGISLPPSIEEKKSWVLEFYEGVQDCCDEYGSVIVVGGDLTKSPRDIFISVSILGKANPKGVPFRSNAVPEQFIAVTGKFGNSNSYLSGITHTPPLHSKHPDDKEYFLRPKPRILEAQKILDKNNASRVALMDTSDGLAQALIEIAEQSKVSMEIDFNSIPKDDHISLKQALYGGEDYELVAALDEVPINFTIIGKTLEPQNSEGICICDKKSQQKLKKKEIYKHF